MVRILDNAGMAKRANVSLAILIAVFLYGLWELLHAATVSGSPTDYIFGVLFVGGALYGLKTTLKEMQGLVVAFDADAETGKARLSFWRPFYSQTIGTCLDRITGWRHWIQTGSRGQRSYFLLAREPSYDGTLRFMLHPGMTIPDVLRRVAGEAIGDFERETGLRQDDETGS